MPSINIIEIKRKKDLRAFIEFPLSLYSDDDFYVPQLTRDMRVHFSEKNPFLRHAEVKFFLAMKDGRIAGRIASIINYRHIKFQKENNPPSPPFIKGGAGGLSDEKTGFFGFF